MIRSNPSVRLALLAAFAAFLLLAMLYLDRGPAPQVNAPVRRATPATPVSEALAPAKPAASAESAAPAEPVRKSPPAVAENQYAPALGTICGIVRDVTPDYSEDKFAALARTFTEPDMSAALGALLTPPDRPVPNVTVTLCYGSEIRQAVTDYRGRFEFTNLYFGDYTIPAEGAGGLIVQGSEADIAWTPQRVRLDSYTSGREFDITFRTDVVSLKGRISDASGRPVAGAQVTGTQCQEDMPGGTPPPPHALSAVSGPDGSYELRGLIRANIYETFAFLMGGDSVQGAHYMIQADAKGFLPARIRVPLVTENGRQPAERLLGIFYSFARKRGADGYRDTTPAPLPSTYGDTITGIDFVLETPASVAGQLVDEHGAPLAERSVNLAPAEERRLTNLVQNPVIKKAWADTDNEGNFTFQDLPSGEYSFRAKTDAGIADIEGVRVRLAPGESKTGVRLVLPSISPGRIEGTVCDARTGGAISDFTATVYQLVESKIWGPEWGTVQKENAGPGTFRVEGIAPGKWRLEITAPGYTTEHLDVEVLPGGTAPLRIALEPSGAVHLRVTQGGAPLHPTDAPTATELETGRVSYAHPSDDGAYEITGIKAGRYKVTAPVFDGKVSRLVTALAVVEAGKATDVTLDLAGDSALLVAVSIPAGMKVTVFVAPIDGNSAPSDASLEAIEKGGDYCAAMWPRTSGEYLVKPLEAGTYCVWARPGVSKGAPPAAAQSQMVTLQAGETSNVRFAFEAK